MHRLIDFFDTQAFTEDQIKDSREHAHTSNLGCHSRANFQRIALLLMVTHFSLSTPLITIPHPLLPVFLKLPSQNPFTAFRVSELSRLSRNFSLSLCADVGQVVSFLIVFSVDNFHEVLSMFEIGLATFSLQHECNVF